MSLQYSSFTTTITMDSVVRLISAAYFCNITYNIKPIHPSMFTQIFECVGC